MNRTYFMSYARSDAAFALKLAQDLRTAGVQLWIDQVDIPAGEPWDQAIERALRSSAGVVVVLSQKAVSSQSVLDEVSFALEENKRVVPVLSEVCDVPLRLRRLQRTDATTDYKGAVRLLALELQKAPLDPVGPEPAPANARRISSGWKVPVVVFGVGGAAVAAVATAFIFAHDPRFTSERASESVTQAALIAALMAGLQWGAVGAIARWRRAVIAAAVAASLVVLIGWMLIGGTYQDVIWTDVILGWPIGALVGASIAAAVVRNRARRGPTAK